jgi:hypothetical protein
MLSLELLPLVRLKLFRRCHGIGVHGDAVVVQKAPVIMVGYSSRFVKMDYRIKPTLKRFIKRLAN